MPAVKLRGGPRPPRLPSSFFPDVFHQRPLHRELCWSVLAERLRSFPVHQGLRDKRRLPCWAPVRFDGEGAAASVVAVVSCLVLDIDEGAEVEPALDRCAPFTVALHTSWSHQEAAPRFRLVLPLSQPVVGERWSEAWSVAVDALALPVDRGCRNANRRYLLPARPQPSSPCSAEVCDTDECIDLAAMLADPPSRRASEPPRRIVVPSHRVQSAIRHRLAHEPGARRRLAEHLGASSRGSGREERAVGLTCPACGRPSVWFLIAPERATRARCNHANSCGWSGPITELSGALP